MGVQALKRKQLPPCEHLAHHQPALVGARCGLDGATIAQRHRKPSMITSMVARARSRQAMGGCHGRNPYRWGAQLPWVPVPVGLEPFT